MESLEFWFLGGQCYSMDSNSLFNLFADVHQHMPVSCVSTCNLCLLIRACCCTGRSSFKVAQVLLWI